MKKCSGHLDRCTGGLGWQKTRQSVTPPGVRQVVRGCELCDHDGAEPLGRQGGVLAVGSIDRFFGDAGAVAAAPGLQPGPEPGEAEPAQRVRGLVGR